MAMSSGFVKQVLLFCSSLFEICHFLLWLFFFFFIVVAFYLSVYPYNLFYFIFPIYCMYVCVELNNKIFFFFSFLTQYNFFLSSIQFPISSISNCALFFSYSIFTVNGYYNVEKKIIPEFQLIYVDLPIDVFIFFFFMNKSYAPLSLLLCLRN